MTSPEGDQEDPGRALPDKIEIFRKEGMDFQVIGINQDQGTHLNLTKVELVNRPNGHSLKLYGNSLFYLEHIFPKFYPNQVEIFFRFDIVSMVRSAYFKVKINFQNISQYFQSKTLKKQAVINWESLIRCKTISKIGDNTPLAQVL